MVRILKALILGWIGKKIYDFTLGAPETEPQKVAHRKAAPKRKTGARKAA